MYKQSSSVRNHNRSKGMKIKYVLRICLLLAVCFWLIYQLKRSHDKKNEFDGNDEVTAALERSSGDEALRLGRKDIPSRERDDEVEEDKMKHKKVEEGEDEATGGRKNGEAKEGSSNAAIEQEEEFIDADDDDNEKIPLEKENEHEEPYKADDASTAVSQENKGSDGAEGPDKGEDTKDLEVEESKNDKESSSIAPENAASNELRVEENSAENGSSPPNAAVATQGFEGNFTSYNSTEAVINDLPLLEAKENGNMLDHSLRNLDEPSSNVVSISNAASEGSNNGSNDSTRGSESEPEKVTATTSEEEAPAETRNRTMLSAKVGDDDSDNNGSFKSSSTYNENLGVAAYESIDVFDGRRDFDALKAMKGQGTDEDEDDDTSAAE